jgi:hypothetical protein
MTSIRTLLQAARLKLAPRVAHMICEWEPLEKRPARLGDDFHAYSEVAIGRVSALDAFKDRQLRICRACSKEPECIAHCVPFGTAKQIDLPKEVFT